MVTESIYNGKTVVIPLADVQHIERDNPLGLVVVTSHTRWDWERDGWANNIWIDKTEADDFMGAWCRYRSELEAGSLKELTPAESNTMFRDHSCWKCSDGVRRQEITMQVEASYTPTVMDGAVVRFKIGENYQINASRSGVSGSGSCPLLTEIGDITTINNLFLVGWNIYQKMRRSPGNSHEIAKLFVEEFKSNQ
jgi:hypothetical protein